MPHTALLIEADPQRMQAVAKALAAQWPAGTLETVRTLAQGAQRLARGGIALVVSAYQLPDGGALDLGPHLGGVPALVVLDEDEAAAAAGALRAGFSDYLVCDRAGGHLAVLPVQAEAVIARDRVHRALLRQQRLLEAILQTQALFIAHGEPHGPFSALLLRLLELTDSRFGFIGEVEPGNGDGDGDAPVLCVHAITDTTWDDAQRARFAAQVQDGMPFPDLDRLSGEALASRLPVISNDPAADPRGGGGPLPGNPVLTAFLGLPIVAGGQLVALVGLANRPGGYGDADAQFLEPLLGAIGQLVLARRAVTAGRAAQARLQAASAQLEHKTRMLELTLGAMAQGILGVDHDGVIHVYNQRLLDLLDLPESLFARHPTLQDVVRLQVERGDFGDDFALVDAQLRTLIEREYLGGEPQLPQDYLRRTRGGRVLQIHTRSLPGGGRVRTFSDMTAYFESQQALRQSEARWRSMTALSADWYWEQDAQLRFVRVEGNGYGQLGLSEGDAHGLTFWELPDTGIGEAQWAAHRATMQARAPFHDFEMQRVGPDGRRFWVSLSGEPIFDAGGTFTGYRGVARNITERRQAEAQIERLAFYDELTGLPNRRLMLERLARAAGAAAQARRHGALLYLDLDNFKDLNDTLGHGSGDRLLEQVAQRLVATVGEAGDVSRPGGDEFAVILEDLHCAAPEAAAQAEAVAQRIATALNRPYHLDDDEVHSSASMGIALFGAEPARADELLQRADLAMYQAKAQGRNALCFFAPSMQARASARSVLEGELRQALRHGGIEAWYQPVVDAAGRPMGVEALARWHHPVRGLVPPIEFIPLAEQTGLILPLGQHMLRLACEQLVRWAAHPGTAHLSVAVNVSAREFRHPAFVTQVAQLIQNTGARARRLKLELTESLLLHDVEDSIAKMNALKTLGVGFSLDDFGTGYSSLSYIKRLPLDQLKIDQSFVRDVLTDANDAVIARTIIALANSLGLDVVAEGVETEGQRSFLLRHGCLRFQGYLYGQPMPAVELEALL